MGLKELFLNKGWAGTTLSRQETIERINPVIRRHYELNHAYDFAVRTLDDRETAETLNALQKTARADIGKLSETVLSAGGVSYNGTDLEPEDFDLGNVDGDIAKKLEEMEAAFVDLLNEELKLDHQIRTQAILGNVLRNSEARLEYVRRVARSYK